VAQTGKELFSSLENGEDMLHRFLCYGTVYYDMIRARLKGTVCFLRRSASGNRGTKSIK
jgi:hypothetical protein